jgi:hypothetical protein
MASATRLTDHSPDAAAQPVLLSPAPHCRFRLAGDAGGFLQADAFTLVERLEDPAQAAHWQPYDIGFGISLGLKHHQ